MLSVKYHFIRQHLTYYYSRISGLSSASQTYSGVYLISFLFKVRSCGVGVELGSSFLLILTYALDNVSRSFFQEVLYQDWSGSLLFSVIFDFCSHSQVKQFNFIGLSLTRIVQIHLWASFILDPDSENLAINCVEQACHSYIFQRKPVVRENCVFTISVWKFLACSHC